MKKLLCKIFGHKYTSYAIPTLYNRDVTTKYYKECRKCNKVEEISFEEAFKKKYLK